jgi:glyoxylase-like metal-dependent hydrolase (beta-lactamase superfamily II)
MALSTSSNFAKPDDAFRAVVEAHRGLNDEQSAALDAALVLILANHIGDLDVLREAIALAQRRMLAAGQQQQQQQITGVEGIQSMAAKGFASTSDMAEKKVTFSEIGTDLYAFTAEGDPNSAVIVGDDGCLVFDAQATPAMANKVIERVRTVTDKPVKYVVLSHYHAVRVLGASAYKAQGIVASQETYRLIEERGQQDWDSEYGRFPRLFQDAQSIPGLTWPTLTFEGEMSIYLGKREVQLMQLGAGHTSGDIVAWVPDAEVMFSGDLIEYHSACYCGDAHLRDWPATLNEIRAFDPRAIAPGRGDALKGIATGRDAIAMTRDFVTTLYGAAEAAVAKGRNLKETMAATREVMDPKFQSFAIYEHCLPFNVSRAFDEASGVNDPVIWTAERDLQMWAALQGG